MMKVLLCLLVTFLLAQAVLCAPNGVKNDARNNTKELRFTIGTSEYVIIAEETGWEGARLACWELGMDLVSIESAEENRALSTYLDNYPYTYFWTSGTRVGTYNEYYWEATGTFLGPYTNWDITSPRLGDGVQYIRVDTFNPGLSVDWGDFYGTYGGMAICELPEQTYDTSIKHKPGLFRIGDGYYEISSIKLPWHHAKNDCRARGMDLLSIETEEENNALIAALQEYVDPFWTSGRYTRQKYRWEATGQDIVLTNWAEGQPVLQAPSGYCLKINNATQARQWVIDDCYAEASLARYVCEFHPRK